MIIRAPYPDYSTEATAYFAAMSVQPDATRKGLINTLISGLKTDGVWTGFDIFKIEAAHDAQAARLNAVAPASNVSSAVNTPTFTTDRGYTGDGSTSYVNLNWAPSAGVQFTQSNASLAIYVNGGPNNAIDAEASIGVVGSLIVPRSAAGVVRGRLNAATTVNATGGTSATRLGLTVLDRNVSTTIYRDGAANGTLTGASTTRSSSIMYQNGLNNSGLSNATTDRIALVFSGRSFNSTEQTAIYSRILTFLTAIGAN